MSETSTFKVICDLLQDVIWIYILFDLLQKAYCFTLVNVRMHATYKYFSSIRVKQKSF